MALNGGAAVSGAGIRSSIADMAKRQDCSDFDVSTMARIMHQYGNTSSAWPEGLAADIETALLGWEYWIDEANGFQGNMMFWTENHQSTLCVCVCVCVCVCLLCVCAACTTSPIYSLYPVSFHSSEYLVGNVFKDKFFPGTNMTGEEHYAKGRDFVLQWMERRYRWGFQVYIYTYTYKCMFTHAHTPPPTYPSNTSGVEIGRLLPIRRPLACQCCLYCTG